MDNLSLLQQHDLQASQPQASGLQTSSQSGGLNFDPQTYSYYQQLYNAYQGHPTEQNAVIQKLYDSANPSNNQNSISTLLNSNLGNTQPTTPQPTPVATNNTPTEDQTSGSFGFGNAPGQLFGAGGLISNVTQPFRQGLIDPAATLLQTGVKSVGDILSGKQAVNTDTTNQELSLNNQAAAAFARGDKTTAERLLNTARGINKTSSQTSAASNQSNAIENQAPILTTDQEHQDYMNNPGLGGIKAAAGIGSFAIPVGEAPSLLGKIALGGAAGSLFGFGTSRPGQEVQGTITGGIGGAATAGVLGKLFPGSNQEAAATAENLFNKENLTPVEQAQKSALADFYTRGEKGSLDNLGKNVLPANMEQVLNDNLSNVENYRLQLAQTDPAMNKITPENIGKIQSAAGQDIQNIVKTTQIPEALQQDAKSFADVASKGSDEIKLEALRLINENRTSDAKLPLEMQDYFSLKKATDAVNQKLAVTAPVDQGKFLSQTDPATGLTNQTLLQVNQAARDAMTKANPELQKPLQTFAFIAQNAKDIAKAYTGGMQNNINVPYLRPAGILRGLANKAQDVAKQGLINQTTGTTGPSLFNDIGSKIPGAVPSIVGGSTSSSISSPNQVQVQSTVDSTLPPTLDPSGAPQGLEQAKQIASQLLQGGYTATQIKSAFSLKGLPNPFLSPSLSQSKTIQQTATAYNSINDLITQIQKNSSQLGSVMGGTLGNALSGSNTGNRQALLAQLKAIPSLYAKITGGKDITNQINPQQDTQTIINNLSQIQQDIYNRYNTLVGSQTDLSLGQ